MNIHSIDLNLLAVLDALLDERNVTRAAARVHLSQPAASNALARLRHLFGDPLLVRGSGGLVPTPRAQALVAPLRAAMNQIEAAMTAGSGFDAATTTASFTLAASDALQIGLVPALLARLTAEAPGARLICMPLLAASRSIGDPVPERELAAGEVDVALGYFPAAPAQLHLKTLFDGDFVCVIRRGHPGVGGRMTLRQFVELGHVVIASANHDRSTVDAALARHKLSRRIAVVVPQYSVVPYLIVRSDLVAVLPRRLAEGFERLFKLRLLEPPLTLPRFRISQVWHERTHQSVAHRWLRGLFADLVGGLAGSEPRRSHKPGTPASR